MASPPGGGWASRGALFLLLGAVVASPAYLVKLHLTGLEPNLLEAIVVAGLALALLAVVTGEARLRPWRLRWPALALLAAGTLAFLWSPDRHASFGIYRQYLVEPVLAGYTLHLLLGTRRRVWWSALAVAGSGVLPAAAEVYTGLRGIHGWRTFDIHPPTGFYLNANFAAEVIVPALMVGLGLALGAAGRRRMAILAGCGFLLLGLGLTYSRGGLLALAGGLVVLWWLGIRRKAPFAIGGLAAAAAALLLVPRMLDRLRHELDPSDPNNTVLSRLPIWRAALRMIRDHPLRGIGLNSFPDQLRVYAPDVQESHTHPHNLFLNFWVVLGLLGFLAYTWVLWWFGRAIAAGLRSSSELRPLYVGLAAALAAILLHGLVDTTIWRNDLGLQFWALVGVATAGLEAA